MVELLEHLPPSVIEKRIGVNLPVYPTLQRVPGHPVYYAPGLESNYFFYDGLYWVYEQDDWYASSWYNGPWGRVAPDGVPLFIEEVTKTLAASVSQVPATLQDSLMARLDQLGAAKELAQTAAVIGREFSRDLLAAVSSLDEPELNEALDRLTASAVVFGRGEPPWTVFTFKHALMEDAAYASLLRSKRLELHSRVADALVALDRVALDPRTLADTAGVLLKYQDDLAVLSEEAAEQLVTEARVAAYSG